MSDFEHRTRGTLEQAIAVLKAPSNTISHIIDNGDGTFSVMSHIVCEMCDYCCESDDQFHVFAAKPDPYELQKIATEEFLLEFKDEFDQLGILEKLP